MENELAVQEPTNIFKMDKAKLKGGKE